MKDFSRVHPKWRETCLHCSIPVCAEDLPNADPDKLNCPAYRRECQVQQTASTKKKAAAANRKAARRYQSDDTHHPQKSL